MRRNGFTLIELLVVIAIIAILSIVVVLTLNPAQLLMQGRDSNRLSDVASLNDAMSIYSEDLGSSFGSPSAIYISIPDPTATSSAGDQCQGLGLPAAPSGITYHCASSSTVKYVDSTGWIPVNFNAISIKAPLAQLPIDPVNQTSSNLYYTYSTNGTQYEITSVLESQKYRAQLAANPMIATYPGVVAGGNNLSLSPLYSPSGLIGYWNFEEGTGSSAIDGSGNGNTGTWIGGAVGTSGYYSAGKVGNWTGTFDGSSTYVTAANSASLDATSSFSFSAWVNPISLANPLDGYAALVDKNQASGYLVRLSTTGALSTSFAGTYTKLSGGTVPVGSWSFVTITYNGTTLSNYVNGQLASSISSAAPNMGAVPLYLGRRNTGGSSTEYFNGYLDDVRVYNRALSVAEIQALYNAQK